MRHLTISQESLENFLKTTSDYAKKIQEHLDKNCCDDETSPQYIYNILSRKTAKKLLSISLPEMEELIKEIQELPGWCWLGITKDNNTIWHFCDTCKSTCLYNIEKAHKIHKDLVELFDKQYDNWAGRKTGFTSYAFIKSLNIKACPYCNLEYVQIAQFERAKVQNVKDKFVRPALDHFYPKAIYPFFALSLNNLVPTCTTCNSSIKGVDNSIKSYKDIIHPYDEKSINYSDCIKYIFLYLPNGAIKKLFEKYGDKELKKIFEENDEEKIQEYLVKNSEKPIIKFLEEHGNVLKTKGIELNKPLEDDAIEISIKGIPGSIKKSSKENITEDEISKYLRAMKMFNYFAIGPRLEQGHNDYIREIAIKTIEYPQDYITDLNDKGYCGSKALRIFFGNYIDPKFFNLRPLSKITHDVIEQLRPELLNKLDEENT